MSQELQELYWHAYLWVLTHRLRGVTGAMRRIIATWPGEFTVSQIEARVPAIYPGLYPARGQVADGVEQLRFFRRVQQTGVASFRVGTEVPRVAIPQALPQLCFSL